MLGGELIPDPGQPWLAGSLAHGKAGTMVASKLVLLLFLSSFPFPASVSSDSWVAQCPATPVEDRLPEVITPMAGSDPIWLVEGSFETWSGPDGLATAVWVLSRSAPGDLIVEGRRLDGPGTLRFQLGVDGEQVERAVIREPHRRSVTPGGASRDVMDQYAFVMMYVIYPSPGCWELTASLGELSRQIVVEQGAPEGGR